MIGRYITASVRKAITESASDSEVSSQAVGELAMEALKDLDGVAYVRFASVYRDFRDARDFEDVLDELAGVKGEDGEP